MFAIFVRCSKYILAHWFFFLLILIGLSLFSFLLYGMDKWKAQSGTWRISEKALLSSAFFFGGIGAFFGMRVFRHKTKHWYFRLFIPLFLILQIALVISVVYAGFFL